MRRLVGAVALAMLVSGCAAAGGTDPPSASPSLATTPTPPPSESRASYWPSAMPTPSAPSAAPSMAARPTYPVGAGIKTITDAVRVRSKPEVSDPSTKFEPTLPIATELHVLAGPVAGSGMWWYRVELPSGVTLNEGIREGWIAAGARDGTPWIDQIADVDCYDQCPPPWPTPVTGWPTSKRGDLVMTGTDPTVTARGGLSCGATIRGLLPGSTVHLAGVGTYQVGWACDVPPVPGASEAPLGNVELLPDTTGTAEATSTGTVDEKGVVSLSVTLQPALPTTACSADPDGPAALGHDWNGIRLSDDTHGLVLTPPRYWVEVTF